jgi:hypothetical protein
MLILEPQSLQMNPVTTRPATPARTHKATVCVKLRTAYGPGFGTGDVLIRPSTSRNPAPEVVATMLPSQGLNSNRWSRPYVFRDVMVTAEGPLAILEIHRDTVTGSRYRLCTIYHEPVTKWSNLSFPLAWTADGDVETRLTIFTGLIFKAAEASDHAARLLSAPGRFKMVLEHWQQWCHQRGGR